MITDSSTIEKGYDFSIASQYPQNIFQNVSPPAAFTGPTDVPMHIDFSHPNADPQPAPTTISNNESEKDQAMEVIKTSPVNNDLKESTDSAPVTSASTTPVISSPSSAPASMTSSQKSNQGRRGSGSSVSNQQRASEPLIEPPKPTRSKTSTPLGTLQKWLSIGSSESRSTSSSSPSGMKQQATNVMEVSKSLVKERIGVFGGGGDKGKQIVQPPLPRPPPKLACSATQTSPDEHGAHFNIGSTPISSVPPMGFQQFQQTGADKGAKASPKLERKKRGGSSRSRSSYRDRERLRSPPRTFEASNTTSFGTPCVEVSHKVAIGPGQAQSLRAVFGAILSHSEIIHDAMACASYLRFITKEFGGGKRDFEGMDLPTTVSDLEESATTLSETTPEGREDLARQASSDKQQSPVVLRKKQGGGSSPARSKCWRHSLEVTTPSRYLRDSSNIKLTPLDASPVRGKANEVNPSSAGKSAHSDQDEDDKIQAESNEQLQLPFAMIALGEIWKYAKSSCSELILHERASPMEHKIMSGKDSTDRKCIHPYGSFKPRSDRSYLQVSGRTFFIG